MSEDSDPFEDVGRLVDELSRLTGEWSGEATAGQPPVDVVDRPGEFVVTVELPGLESDDVEVRLSEETLHVRAERGGEDEAADESEATGATYVRRERNRGPAERAIELPSAVEESGVSASLSAGLLTVTLPKAAPDEGAVEVDVE